MLLTLSQTITHPLTGGVPGAGGVGLVGFTTGGRVAATAAMLVVARIAIAANLPIFFAIVILLLLMFCEKLRIRRDRIDYA